MEKNNLNMSKISSKFVILDFKKCIQSQSCAY